MVKNKFISVIMGVYNSKPERLELAVGSILNQTYSNFELIICNDCSTNNDTINCLKELQRRDKRIKVINNDINAGLAKSLNNCLKIAKGEYIARMDDDDISHIDRFEKQVYFLNTYQQYDFVGCAIRLFDENGYWGTCVNKEKPQKKDFLFGTPFTHPTIMVRSEAYIKAEGYDVNNYTRRTEDYDLFMRMYALGMKGYNLSEILFDYRMDDSGYKKQKFKYRIDEMIIKYKGFKSLKLFPRGYVYLIKPIISGLIPNGIKKKLYQKRYSRKV